MGMGKERQKWRDRGGELVRKENKGKTCKGLISVGLTEGQVTEITRHIYIAVLSGGWRKEGA